MEISVIMLTYNREDMVENAVKSILNQTYADFEFIIVDNGSTDASGRIADRFAAEDGRVRVCHTDKKSIGAGRNMGLSCAKGEYVTFIDDDDTAEPDMLEFLLGLARKYEADISICSFTKTVNGAVQPVRTQPEPLVMGPAEAVVELFKRKKYNVGLPTKLIRRHLTERARFSDTGAFDDINTTYRYMANAKRVVFCGVPKYHVFRHGGNNSAFTDNHKLLTPELLEEYFEAYRERTAYIAGKLPEIAGYARYSEWSFLISMCDKISVHHLDCCGEQLRYIRERLGAHFDEFLNSPYTEDFEKEWLVKYVER